MHYLIWLLMIFWPCLPVWAHVRLVELTTRKSIQLYPQHWQARDPNRNESQELYCEAEEIQHSYEWQAANGSLILQQHHNCFGRTKAGELATMRDLCLDEHGLPVRRLCGQSNAIVSWQQLQQNVTCRAGNKLSQRLNQLLQSQSKPVMLQQLRQLLNQAHGQLAPIDIYSTAQIMAKLLEQHPVDAVFSSDLISICQAIMSSDLKVLQIAAQLNATNSLLSKFEYYMDALPQQLVPQESCGKATNVDIGTTETDVEIVNYAHIGVQALMSSNLSVFYVNPNCVNITGIAVYSVAAPNRSSSRSGFWYRFLYAKQSLEQLRQESQLETASYLPEQLWSQLQHRGASYLIFKVYAHDALFVSTTQQRFRRPRSKVLSISIPGFETGVLPSALPFLLQQPQRGAADSIGSRARGRDRDRGNGNDSGCGYWNYDSWISDGVTTTPQWGNSSTVLCQAEHLTQFTFLVGGSYNQEIMNDELPTHEQLLDMITLLGCGLSLFGLLGIFLTAGLVSKWRSQASTKVLLHLCLALTLQLLLFAGLSGGDWTEQLGLESNWKRCLFLGAALQYSVLVIFSWMLIIAYLQFQRYVTVIGVARPQHYILISAIVAWTLPLLPTLLVVLLDSKSYKPSSKSALCYPSGYSLAFGIILPIALITIANIFMMSCITYSIHRALNPRRQLIIQQLRLSVLLFFLLGLTWIFGLCSYLRLGILFAYLFCLTATLQGFVLFVYFVVLNRVNRSTWLGIICPTQMKMDMPRRTTELSSIDRTLSTNYSKSSQC